MLQNAYKQNLKPISNTRTFEPKKKVQPQKPIANKSLPVPQSKKKFHKNNQLIRCFIKVTKTAPKSNIQTPTKKRIYPLIKSTSYFHVIRA